MIGSIVQSQPQTSRADVPVKKIHAKFAETVTGVKLNGHLIKRLNDQELEFLRYANYVIDSDGYLDILTYLSVQIAHIVLLPLTAVKLVFQIAGDLVLYTAFALARLITFDQSDDIAIEHNLRAYNLFVDVVVLASLPVSIIFSNFYKGTQSLHLGTFRKIQWKKDSN